MRIFRNWSSWRRLRYVIVTTMAITPIWFLAGSYILFTPKKYEAAMTIILPGDGPNASVNLDQVGQATMNSSSPWASSRLSPVESYRKLMMTDTVRREAAAARGLSPDNFPPPKIKLVDQTNFIMITIRGLTPDGATANANAFLDAFLAKLNRLRRDFAESREFANRSALVNYKENVARAQEKLLAYQAESGLASADQYGETIALVDKLSRRVQNIDAEIGRRAGEVSALQTSLKITPDRAAAALKLRADPVFQAMLTETAEKKIAYDQAVRRYGERHPAYEAAKREYLGAAQPMIRRGEGLTGLDSESFRALGDLSVEGTREGMFGTLVENAAARDGLIAERKALQAQLTFARAETKRLSAPAAELDRLARDHQVAEAVFVSAIARADTTKTDLFAAYPMAQVIEAPVASGTPVSPSTKIGLIAAIAGTIFVAGGLILAWMRMTILRWLGRLFAHPSAEISAALKSNEPAAPRREALDDEPLVEIPHQVPPHEREVRREASDAGNATA